MSAPTAAVVDPLIPAPSVATVIAASAPSLIWLSMTAFRPLSVRISMQQLAVLDAELEAQAAADDREERRIRPCAVAGAGQQDAAAARAGEEERRP